MCGFQVKEFYRWAIKNINFENVRFIKKEHYLNTYSMFKNVIIFRKEISEVHKKSII